MIHSNNSGIRQCIFPVATWVSPDRCATGAKRPVSVESFSPGLPDSNDGGCSTQPSLSDAAPLLRLATAMSEAALRLEEARAHCATRLATLTDEADALIARSLDLVSKQRALVRERRELLAVRRQLLDKRLREMRRLRRSLRSRSNAAADENEELRPLREDVGAERP